MPADIIAHNLANSIAACRDIPREELLESFTEVVSRDHDEAEFARAFSVSHRLFHDWMAG